MYLLEDEALSQILKLLAWCAQDGASLECNSRTWRPCGRLLIIGVASGSVDDVIVLSVESVAGGGGDGVGFSSVEVMIAICMLREEGFLSSRSRILSGILVD